MASSRTMQSGDTYPPLQGLATDESGIVDLTTATLMRAVLKGKNVIITLTATVLTPVLVVAGESYNWEALFSPGDTDQIDTYTIQLKVTWPNGKTETFPNRRAVAPTLTIEQAN